MKLDWTLFPHETYLTLDESCGRQNLLPDPKRLRHSKYANIKMLPSCRICLLCMHLLLTVLWLLNHFQRITRKLSSVTTTTSVCKRLLAQILAFMMLTLPYLRLIFWKLLVHAYLRHRISRAASRWTGPVLHHLMSRSLWVRFGFLAVCITWLLYESLLCA